MLYFNCKNFLWLFLFFIWGGNMMSANQHFGNFQVGAKYRFVNVKKEGAIGVGANHGSQVRVLYVSASEAASPDCYWIAEAAATGWRFRNAQTGQYLAFTPAKDYTTFVRLTLTDKADAPETIWQVSSAKRHYVFSYTDDKPYFWSLEGNMVAASSGSGDTSSNLFDVYDEHGKQVEVPAYTYVSKYISDVAINQRLLPYDERAQRYFFPIPTSATGNIDFSFAAVDNAQYQIVVYDANGAVVRAWSQVNAANGYQLAVLREGREVARGAIVFTTLPVLDITYRGEIAPPVLPDGTIQKPTLPGTVHVLGNDPQHDLNCSTTFRRRGATATNYPKRSLNMKLFRSEGVEMDTTLLGLRNDKSWILDAMAIDVMRMRNRVCFDVWNSFSPLPYDTKYERRNGTQGRFVELIINGDYAGIYCLTDKIDRQLLNLTKPELTEGGDLKNVRGVLYKSNLWEHTSLSELVLDEKQPMTGTDWNSWELQVPDDYPSPAAWKPLRDLYAYCTQLTINPRTQERNFDEHFYLQNLSDFYLLVLAYDMVDNGNKNMFLSVKNIQKGKRFVVTPWDMDTSLGGYYDGRFHSGTYENTAVQDARIRQNEPFFTMWTWDVNGFRKLTANRWFKLRKSIFSAETLAARLTTYGTLFTNSGAWAREYARWNKGTPIVPNIMAEIPLVVEWYKQRMQEMDKFFLPHTDDPTGISTLSPNAVPQDVHTLDGRRISWDEAARGLYIVGGQKVVK